MNDVTVDFGDRLNDLMQRADMTPARLQEAIIRLGSSVSYPTICNWRDGRCGPPSGDMCRLVCLALGCHYEDLIGPL